MRKVKDVTGFEIIDGNLIYAVGDTIHWHNENISIDQTIHTFIQTENYLTVITGSDNLSFTITKENLRKGKMEFKRIPRFANRFSYNEKKNQLLLFSGIFQDERRWILSLENNIESEFSQAINFVPHSEYVYYFGAGESFSGNGVIFLDSNTGEKLQELPFSREKNSIPDVLGKADNRIWLRMSENELVGLDLKSGATKTLRPYDLISAQGIDQHYIGFGDETNTNRFHIDSIEKRVITFANRYYLEISLVDFSTKVLDLFDISPRKFSIVKSRLYTEKKWMYFIGRSRGDQFDKYLGVFDTASGKILQIDKADDSDGFFGQPPIYGDNIYGAVTSENVLYVNENNF